MTLTHSKIRTAVVTAFAAAMLLALLPASPADASHPGVGATGGVASLSGGIGTCGTFTFAGVGAAVAAPGVVSAGNVTASGNYCNPDTATGSATGTLTFTGSIAGVTQSCNFKWQRVGLIALIEFTGGSCGFVSGVPTAIAAFVPIATTNDAVVVGAGVF